MKHTKYPKVSITSLNAFSIHSNPGFDQPAGGLLVLGELAKD